MLITAFVFIMIAVVIGIIFLRNFTKEVFDNEDRGRREHPHRLKEAASMEAAQELYPFEETKGSIAPAKHEPDTKRSHLQVVPDMWKDKAKDTGQAVTPKPDVRAKSNVQTATPKLDAKAKSNVQTVTPKLDAKAKSTVQTATPKLDAKAKSTELPATPKVDAKAKSNVPPATPKVDAKAKSIVPPATPKVDAKAKSTVPPATPKVDAKAKSTVQTLSYSQADSNSPSSFLANEQPYQQVWSQSIDSAALIPLSLEKQLDNIEVTENKLQLNVYHNLVQQLEEASTVLAQIDDQIKFIELTNFIDDEFTKLSTNTEHQENRA
ncbi:hypothetical protein [Paenibacillus ehimensis]|uniref:hypothetical protein n=1 Tax=Paenibacillus ehimensis TaxID=79264 RepID=UPI000FD88230|nr:hypothetical protein [Paenibacillus ehimensis]